MKKLLIVTTLLLSLLHASFAQVSLVKGFPGHPNSVPARFEPLNNLILFNIDAGLWKSDGTTAGTVLLNANFGFPANFKTRCRVGNAVFFAATPSQIWKTDGTIAGTVLVKDIGTQCFDFVNLNGVLIFTARSATGMELWRSDGTAAGTVLVTDLDGANDGVTSPLINTAVLNGFLYFSGPSVVVPRFGSPQPEVWRTDGSATGTTRVSGGGYQPLGFNVIDNKLIYSAYYLYPGACPSDPTTSHSAKVIMKVEGATASVLKESAIVNFCPEPRPLGNTFVNTSKFIKAGNYLYFRGQEESNQGGNHNLWCTNGTNVIKLTNFDASTPGAGLETLFWQEGINDFGFDAIFFCPIITAAQGLEVWRSDGTTGGTFILKDILVGTNGSSPGEFRTAGGITYFFASDGTRGPELWKSDGTNGGTVLVETTIRAGQTIESGGSSLSNVNRYAHSVGNRYYFSGNYNNAQGLYTPCSSTIPVLSALPSGQVCSGSSTNLSASGCNGTLNWNTGATGNSILVSPSSTTTYTATCNETNCPVGTTASITVTIAACPLQTLKPGNWNDPTVWSENRVPGSTDDVRLNHIIILLGNYIGQVRRIIYLNGSRLMFGGSSQLKRFGN